MILTLKRELKDLRRLLTTYYREWIVLSLSTLFLILKRTNPLGSIVLDHFVYFFALPVITIVLLLRANPLDFGLRFGNVRLWGTYLVAAIVVSLPILVIGGMDPSVVAFYKAFHGDSALPMYVLNTIVILFAWEFIFRGFMLFGLEKTFKQGAIFIQMVPFALLHLGKPRAEVIICVVTGVLFGYVSSRSRSFWPAFLIHLFLNLANRVIVDLQA